MNVLKNGIAVIAGYVIFVISAVLLFQVSGIDPHADPSLSFAFMVIMYGMSFSFTGGLVTQLISGSRKLAINYILAALIAAFAIFSLFKTGGNHYSQLAAIILFAPTSILGGLFYLKKVKK